MPKKKLTIKSFIKNNQKRIVTKVLNLLNTYQELGMERNIDFENYSDFCDFLEIPKLEKKARDDQLQALSIYLDFYTEINPKKRNTKKYIITNALPYSFDDFCDLLEFSIFVYLENAVRNIDDFNNSPAYTYCKMLSSEEMDCCDEQASNLMKPVLTSSFKNTIFANKPYMIGNMSLNTLAKGLGCFSSSYLTYMQNRNKLSCITHIKSSVIQEFYDRTKDVYERALKNFIEKQKKYGVLYFQERFYGTPVISSEAVLTKYKVKNQYNDEHWVNSFEGSFKTEPIRYLTNSEIAQYLEIKNFLFIFLLWAHSPLNIEPVISFPYNFDTNKVIKRNASQDKAYMNWYNKNVDIPIPDFSLIMPPLANELNQKKFSQQSAFFFSELYKKNITMEYILRNTYLSNNYYSFLNTISIHQLHLDNITLSYDIFFNSDNVLAISQSLSARLQLKLTDFNKVMNQQSFIDFWDYVQSQVNSAFSQRIKENADKRFNNRIKNIKEQFENQNIDNQIDDQQIDDQIDELDEPFMFLPYSQNENDSYQINVEKDIQEQKQQKKQFLSLVSYLIEGQWN